MDLFTANMLMGVGSAIGQIGQGNADRIRANAQAALDDYLADVQQKDSLKEAELIRKAGRRQVGAAVAAYAGAGVVVGEGSALETERQIDQDVEHDAYQAIIEGNSRALGLRTEGKLSRIAGRQAQVAGYVNAAGSLLASGYRGTRGWKTGKVTPEDLDFANGSSDPIGALNARMGWTG